MRKLPPLSALRAFEAAARHASFKLAADELAVTPTAISHQIRSLEADLGVPLFERLVRKVVLTQAGASLYPTLRDGFDAFEHAIGNLVAQRSRRTLGISATSAFMSRWLAPRAARFQQLHPDIDLALHASNRPVDLGTRDLSLAIRYGPGPYPGLVAEALFADRFVPVASPALASTGADPDGLALIDFTWARADPSNPTWEKWMAAAGRTLRRPAGQLRFSDEDHAIQAALAGQGAALLSLTLVEADLQAGRLVRLAGPSIPAHTYHLVSSSHQPLEAHAVAAQQWLRAEAQAARALQA